MEDLMKLQTRRVKITNEKWINLNEQTLFKANGEEGLHLWESSILFSRYINKNKSLFDNKEVIELGSGCGLLGMTCLMYTSCNHLVFSDYQESVLNNLLNNIKLNKFNHNHKNNTYQAQTEDIHCLACYPGRYSILKLDWRDYNKYKFESYDCIVGSELIYSGGHIEELAKLIRNLLKIDGTAYITMPEKRSMTTAFLKYLEENELFCTYSPIEDEELYDVILEDQKESKKLFEDLKSMKIILYEITRVKK